MKEVDYVKCYLCTTPVFNGDGLSRYLKAPPVIPWLYNEDSGAMETNPEFLGSGIEKWNVCWECVSRAIYLLKDTQESEE